MADEIPSGTGRPTQFVAGVLIHNEVIGYASSKSARYAKIRAANKALEEIDGLAPYEFRSRFGCDCHLKAGAGSEGSDVQGEGRAIGVEVGTAI